MKNLFLFSFLIATLFVSSCSKSIRDKDTDLTSVEDQVKAEAAINDVFTIVDNIAKTNAGFYRSANFVLPACATLTTDTIASPKIMTLDFGTVNCASDSKNRRGKIMALFYGKVGNAGGKIEITFDNYYLNDFALGGGITIYNKGKNTHNETVYSITGKDFNLGSATGTIYYTTSYTYEWTIGADTPLITDDVYYIKGTAKGISSLGGNFSCEILDSLKLSNSCANITSGTLKHVPNNLGIRTLNYGVDACDATVAVSFNGLNKEVTIK